MSAADKTKSDHTSSAAQSWLTVHLSADDAKLLSELFTAQAISSVADVLLLSKDDLTELKVSIGVRNRFLEAQQKAKEKAAGGSGSGSGSGVVPVAPPAPKTPPKPVTSWYVMHGMR